MGVGDVPLDPFGWVGGTVAGKYRVDVVVAEGGFGVVYRAHHLGFDTPVALKCLKLPARLQGAEREEFLKAFVEEGRLLHQLSRATVGIVQAMDVGADTSPSGTWTPYLALEWLDGATLEQDLVARATAGVPARTLTEAIALLEPAARALAVAHERGIAHRDIKPANLFVTDLGGRRIVKVVDFGIAKVMTEVTSLTRAMQATGASLQAFTPQYGAPEQFDRTRYGATGPWSDVFAFALVLVEVLTGRPALDGGDTTQCFISSIHPERRPTPRRCGVHVSDGVEAVMARAVAVEPRDRFHTLGDFWDALVAAAGQATSADAFGPTAYGRRSGPTGTELAAPSALPVLAQPGAPLVPPPPPTRRSTPPWGWIAAAAGGGCVVVAGVVGLVIALGGRKAAPETGATAPSASASSSLAVADAGQLPMPGAKRLASGLSHPIRFAVGTDAVFVAEQGSSLVEPHGAITRVPKDGGPATTLVGGLSFLTDVRVDDSQVYWASSSGIWAAPLAGAGGQRQLYTMTGKGHPSLVSVDASTVTYSVFKGLDDGSLETVSKRGGQPHELFSGASFVYAASSRQYAAVCTVAVGVIPRSDPGSARIVERFGPSSTCDAIAIDDVNVYWVRNGALYQHPINGDGSTKLAGMHPLFGELPLRGDTFYWAEKDDEKTASIHQFRPGSASAVIASGLPASLSFAFDDSHIYWATMDDGELWSAPFVSSASGPSARATAAADAPAVQDQQQALKTLRLYYDDFNAGRFDANRYFAPNIVLYITMKNTTPGQINQYMTNLFPKQFQDFHASFDESSLAPEGSDAFVFRQRGRYFQVATQKQHDNTASVRVRFDASGKITYFQEFAVVEEQ